MFICIPLKILVSQTTIGITDHHHFLHVDAKLGPSSAVTLRWQWVYGYTLQITNQREQLRSTTG